MSPLRRPHRGSLLRMSGVSFVLHIALVLLLSLNPFPTIVRARPEAYMVTLMPVSLPEPEKKPSLPVIKEEIPKPIEKPVEKPIEKPKKDDIVEKIKKTPRKEETVEKEKDSLKHLQEAIEEIRKKAALDEIQKKVSRRERVEERPIVTVTNPPVTNPPVTNPPLTNLPLTSSLKSPSERESKLSEYYSKIWTKIKGMWTIPENLLKEMADLETVVVISTTRDGKIKEMWVEKRSGNALYDQMAIRAIKKAEPLPPIPKELGENTLEIGIRFLPD